jgi:LEA14-like dessication related protein
MVRFLIFIVYCLIMLSGCTLLNIGYETPSVSVTSFQIIPTPDLAPRFKIGLHIINPNNSPLKLEGIYYSLEIEGHDVIEGVNNQLPTIAAYAAGDIVLDATANIINSLRLIADLAQQTSGVCSYKLKAKLSPGMMRPSIRVVKQGEVSLRALTR